MTRDEKVFLSINNDITAKVRVGNCALVDVKGKDTISINMKGNSKQIHDLLYLPNLEEICLVLVNSWNMVILLCLEKLIVGLMIKLSHINSLFK